MSDAPDDEIEIGWESYGPGDKPRDLTFTFRERGVHLGSREVECDGDRYFIVTRPDGSVQRYRQNPESGKLEKVDEIPCGDPE